MKKYIVNEDEMKAMKNDLHRIRGCLRYPEKVNEADELICGVLILLGSIKPNSKEEYNVAS